MRKFPYREEGNPPRLRPTVDVELRHGDTGILRTRALIDTGSPITIFDHASASALLVRLGQAGADTACIAMLGRNLTIQFEYLDMCLVADETVNWTARVGFVTDAAFEMPFQGVLGTNGFLDKWAVTFNPAYDYFLIQHPDDAPG